MNAAVENATEERTGATSGAISQSDPLAVAETKAEEEEAEISKEVKDDSNHPAQIGNASHPQFGRHMTMVHFLGEDANSKKDVNAPTVALSQVAHIKTKYSWFDTFWLFLVTFLTPAVLALIWFGAIPLGDAEGDFSERVVWCFVVNAGTYTFFTFMLVNIFLACLDGNSPWRPFKYYAPILLRSYVGQLVITGTIVLVHGTFRLLGLAAMTIAIGATVMGLRMMPHHYFDCDRDRYLSKLRTFEKILFYFVLFWLVLVGYIITNGTINSSAQGFLTVVLSVLTFIFKKIFLSLTDAYPIEVSMVIAGLWLENIVDLFIALAYPTATSAGATFVVIWLTRVAENTAFLGFQLDAWFRFRVWIKGKFKSSQQGIVEEDVDPDDRGHSNQHPGYRRRQMRFLIWKLLSQISSSIFFLTVIPALRYGQNNHEYPYSEDTLDDRGYLDDETVEPFKNSTFEAAMYFAAFSMFTTVCSGVIIFWWMWRYHQDVLKSLHERYRYLIVSDLYFGFVLTILISNVLLAVSAVQVNNRLYFI